MAVKNAIGWSAATCRRVTLGVDRGARPNATAKPMLALTSPASFDRSSHRSAQAAEGGRMNSRTKESSPRTVARAHMSRVAFRGSVGNVRDRCDRTSLGTRNEVESSPLGPSSMSTSADPSADPQRTFVEHLAVIDRVIGVIARRHALSAHDADEFAVIRRQRMHDPAGSTAAAVRFLRATHTPAVQPDGSCTESPTDPERTNEKAALRLFSSA
jgi:hypothetical protein